MRTILYGPVDMDTLAMAAVFDIVPTCFVVHDRTPPPPVEANLPVWYHPVERKLGHGAEAARDYTLCQNADALIITDNNPHLLQVARQYKLAIFEA